MTEEGPAHDPGRKRIPQIEIVRRAYKIWQDSGEPDGKDDEFYHRAERELEEERDRGPQE